ncbi:MAG: hypothetical protein CR972_02820 [Candidatus Moraniibacteriota bacterium]|nr:MAG: hypothetical protein CR972_02820 [Candidatus Moranbacteria bacterium]
MSDQNTNSVEKNLSPEYVSLEERFSRVDKEDRESLFEKKDRESEKAFERNTAESDSSYNQILSKVQEARSVDDMTVMQDASVLDQQADRESQITHLIDLAMTKGVYHAVKVAQKAEDYYVLDQLRDRLLADDLHSALISKGLIEE